AVAPSSVESVVSQDLVLTVLGSSPSPGAFVWSWFRLGRWDDFVELGLCSSRAAVGTTAGRAARLLETAAADEVSPPGRAGGPAGSATAAGGPGRRPPP